MKNLVYLILSILEISKTVMYEFWYDYVKLKYDKKQNYVTWIQIVSLFIQKQKILQILFVDTSSYELEKPLLKGKNVKVIGLMNHESGGKIMKTFVGLRIKTYSHLTDDNNENKKRKVKTNFNKKKTEI